MVVLKHWCKANRCASEIRSGHAWPVLMCRKHWMMVPEAIRFELDVADGAAADAGLRSAVALDLLGGARIDQVARGAG